MKRWHIGAAVFLIAAAVAVVWGVHSWRLSRHPAAPAPQAREANGEGLSWQLAALACGGPVHRGAQGEAVCPVCPQGSDFAGQPAAKGDDSDTSWTAGGLILGHFTNAQANEAVLKSHGCESHANGFGGDFLLRQQAGQWQRVRYIQAGQIDNSCQRLRWTERRDALVCQTGDMHQGLASLGADLYTVEPTATESGEGLGTEFLGVSDDEGACLDEQTPQWLQSASLDGVDLLPRPDGRQDVAIRASIGRIRGKPDSAGNCPVAPKKPYRIVFRNDGDHFTAGAGVGELRALKSMDCCEVNVGDVVKPYRY